MLPEVGLQERFVITGDCRLRLLGVLFQSRYFYTFLNVSPVNTSRAVEAAGGQCVGRAGVFQCWLPPCFLQTGCCASCRVEEQLNDGLDADEKGNNAF